MTYLKNIKGNSKSSRQLLWMVFLAAGFFAIGWGAILLFPDSQETSSLPTELSAIPMRVDFQAPKLSMPDLSSNNKSLDDYLGLVILVNNWATWCPPCKAEMPTLQKYFQAHNNQGFIVIAIESGESVDEVTDFVQQNSLTFPVWIDIDGLALEKFNNWDLPSSYLIDRDGRVRLTWTGPISMEMLEKYVTPFLEQ